MHRGEKTAKRKGLGGLSPDKKKLLKQLIIQKAAADLRQQKERQAEERKKLIESRVPKLNIDGLGEKELLLKVRQLHAVVSRLEEEKYDWEMRIQKQDLEINELNIKTNDIKGHFVKPMLKKVAKPEQKFQVKFDGDRLKSKLQFLTTLKSTGHSKFALEEKDEVSGKKPDWSKEQLKQHKDTDSDERSTGLPVPPPPEDQEDGDGGEEEEEEEDGDDDGDDDDDDDDGGDDDDNDDDDDDDDE